MAADILSRSQVLGWFPQSDAATPGDAATNYEPLKVNADSVTVDGDIDYSQNDITSATGLMIERARSITDSVSGSPKIDFSMPADLYNLAPLIYLALGSATEVTTTPYQKIIAPSWLASVPDFASATHAGIPPLWTLAGYRYAAASDGYILTNALLNTLNIDIDFNARGVAKLMQVSGQFLGKSLSLGQNLSGTFDQTYTSTFLNDSDDTFALTIAGILTLTPCIKRYSLRINNNIFVDCKTTGGAAENYKMNPEIITEITIPYNSTSYAGVASAVAGTETTFTLSKGGTGVTGYVNIVTKGRIIGNPQPTGNSGYQDLTFTMRCEKPASGSPITVTIADAKDRNYPAP